MVKHVKKGADMTVAYDIGYGKPPEDTRFRKGQSGNARGRPKGAKNLATQLAAALNESVVVTENGRRRKITKREAICHQLANRSAGGDLAALRLLIPLMTSIDAQEAGTGFEFDPATEQAMAKALLGRLDKLDDHDGEDKV